MKIDEITFFSNGNTFVSDGNNQVSKLQESWFLLYVKFLKSKGIKVDEKIVFNFPNGKTAKYMPKYNNWKFD